MGNRPQTPSFHLPFNPTEWQQLPMSHKAPNNIVTYQNIINRQLIDRYEIEFGSRDEENLYRYWCIQRYGIAELLRALHYDRSHHNGACYAHNRFFVYVQHAWARLSQIACLGYQHGIYVMGVALSGFHYLYRHHGYFDIHQKLISFTNKGQCKVWLNENPIKITSQNIQIINIRRTQRYMVQKIIQIVQNKITQESPNQSTRILFSKYRTKYCKGMLCFSKAKEIFGIFCREEGIQIGDHCASIREYLANGGLSRENKRDRGDCRRIFKFQKDFFQNGEGLFKERNYIRQNTYKNYQYNNKGQIAFFDESRTISIWKQKLNKSLNQQIYHSRRIRHKRTLADDLQSQSSFFKNSLSFKQDDQSLINKNKKNKIILNPESKQQQSIVNSPLKHKPNQKQNSKQLFFEKTESSTKNSSFFATMPMKGRKTHKNNKNLTFTNKSSPLEYKQNQKQAEKQNKQSTKPTRIKYQTVHHQNQIDSLIAEDLAAFMKYNNSR